MAVKLQIDGVNYSVKDLSDRGRSNLNAYQHASTQIEYATNMLAILTRAKNSYILDLKSEILQEKTGVDLSTLFDDLS